MSEDKIKELAGRFLKLAADKFSDHICNDVSDKIWEGWSLEERKQFVKEYEDWNSKGEDYREGWFHLPDFAIMAYLAHKLINNGKETSF